MDVIPSFMQDSVGISSDKSGFDLRFMENHLRIGQVTNIFPPSHPSNLSKKVYEYEVLLYVYNGSRSFSTKFVNAVVADTFGSIADRTTYTPRKTTSTNGGNLPASKGSLVLVLCVNSDMQQSVIVGGFPNNNLPTTNEDLGHHLSFEFNGVQFDIDKDGQVAIKRRGPTNDEGAVISGQEQGGGATVVMASDGSVSIQSGNGNEVKVDLDATNGSLNLTCTEGVIVNSGQHPMVRGDKLLTAMEDMYTTMVNAFSALPSGAGAAAVLSVNSDLLTFKATESGLLSAKNKVD